jgi:DNA gyrase subunit A
MLALVGGVPRVLNLKETLSHFLNHRHEVVVRRTEYDLAQALEREHILEGLKIAVDNIDEVIELIRSSPDTEEANTRLQARFGLSERQAKAILDMRLARLTGLETEKLEAELAEVRTTIGELREILGSLERRHEIIKEELRQVATTYGDPRRTEIVASSGDLSIEDLLADEEMVITVSHGGYIKRIPLDTYRLQRRGGRGLMGMETKEEDWVEHLFLAHTHDYLTFFTRQGHCYWLKVHEIPQAGRNARGRPIVNLLALRPDEQIAATVPIREFKDDRYLIFATRNGVVKKTALRAYGNVRVVGVNGINIDEGDELIDVQVTDGDDEIILATHNGLAIRFHESDVRVMGRATTGVRGVSLAEGDRVIGMVVVRKDTADEATLLVATEKGGGKRSRIEDYRLQRRGGKGVINIRISERTGRVIAIKEVLPDDELVLVTRNGVVNRQRVGEIRVIGRATQGVRLMALDPNDQVVDVARLLAEEANGEHEEAEASDDLAAADETRLAPAGGAPSFDEEIGGVD